MWPIALMVYIFSTIGFSGANIFYDSLLPSVSNEENVDDVSALGFSLGYLVTAFSMRFESLAAFSIGSYRKILSIPLFFSSIICLIIWYLFEFTEYANQMRELLSFGLISIFVLWQFAQAWWMRVPFKEIALNRMIKVKDKNTSEFGRYANVFAPIIWSIIGFGIVLVYSEILVPKPPAKITTFIFLKILFLLLINLLVWASHSLKYFF